MRTAICTLIKNEHKFIKEWVDYHLKKGIDHIHLFEDFTSKSHAAIFKGYDNVTITPLTGNNFGIQNLKGSARQLTTWTYFLNKCKEEDLYDWVLFSDNDEFLMFDEGYNLEKLLEEFKDYAGIHLAWKMYGCNGHIKAPECGVLEAYTKPCAPDELSDIMPKWNHKSFVNVKVAEKFLNLHIIKDGVNVLFDKKGYSNGMVHQKAWLNHYYSKSWEDYVWKMTERGNFSSNYRTFDEFFKTNKDLLPMKNKMIQEVMNMPLKSSVFISKEMGLISGSNVDVIKELKERIFNVRKS